MASICQLTNYLDRCRGDLLVGRLGGHEMQHIAELAVQHRIILDRVMSLVREFINDVEVVDVDYVAVDWPDLHETYHKARSLLKEITCQHCS